MEVCADNLQRSNMAISCFFRGRDPSIAPHSHHLSLTSRSLITMSPHPIDPLRIRIFSELNLQLGHHGIEKDLMNETAKHLAFLVRFYCNDLHPDPLSVSVPILDVPLLGPSNEVTMVHKIALVVQQAGSGNTLSSDASFSSSIAEAKNNAVMLKDCAAQPKKKERSVPRSVRASRVKVLIENRGVLGHRRCLINGFSMIAERVVAGLLAGDKEMWESLETKLGKDEENGVGLVWDISPCSSMC